MRTNSSRLSSTSPLLSAARTTDPVQTVLVVDDDEAVRKLAAEILSQEGYSVLQAESAGEALRLARQAGQIHLLITDLAMPGLDGLELTRRFRAMHPKTPVLVVSGSLALLRGGIQELNGLQFLAKPFAFNELLRKARSLLEAAPSLAKRKPCCCD